MHIPAQSLSMTYSHPLPVHHLSIHTWNPFVLCFGGWALKKQALFYNQNLRVILSVRFGISAPRDWNPRRYRLHHPPAETVSFCHHMSPFPDVDSPVRFFLNDFQSWLISVLKRIRGFPIYVNDQIYKINGKGHSSSQL